MSPGGLPLLLGLGLAVAYGAVLLRTWWLLTRPPRRSLGWALGRGLAPDPGHLAVGPGGAGLRFGPLTVASRGRRLAVWDIVGLDPEGPVMLLTHGWGESRIASLPRVAALAPLASRLICWDLPGHGDSGGACALGLREADDLARVVQAAGSERRLVLVGSSLGAGVSIAAAARSVPAAAVIAEGPYRFAAAPARATLRGAGYPWRLVLPPLLAGIGLRHGAPLSWAWPDRRGALDPVRTAAKLRAPLLVLHGDRDQIAPAADARAIAEAAPHGRLRAIAGAGHTDVWSNPASAPLAVAAVREFLAGAWR